MLARAARQTQSQADEVEGAYHSFLEMPPCVLRELLLLSALQLPELLQILLPLVETKRVKTRFMRYASRHDSR